MKGNFQRIIIILVVLLASVCMVRAQEKPVRQIQVGLKLNYGYVNERLPEDKIYQPILFLGFYQHDFFSKSDKANFSLYFEPQFNPVLIDHKLKDYEFGFNFGIQYSYKLSEFNTVYGAIGSGPHFTSVNTTLQARGFIFSDNFILGYKRQVKDDLYLDLSTRFRHISNAGFKSPNYGIDNFFMGVGVLKGLGLNKKTD